MLKFAQKILTRSAVVCTVGSQQGVRTSAKGLVSRTFSSGKAGSSVYEDGAHRSNAEKLISAVPVITVNATVAVCDGGSGALGHPVEYIQLDTVSKEPAVCKYCGLRYKMGEVHAH